MIKRRSNILILRDILKTIRKENGKAKPTHILYGANLSYDRLQKYLIFLIDNGFIEKKEEDGKIFYLITIKGHEYLSGLKKMENFFEAFGLNIN